MISTLPDQGIIFWPVGNGDSTTICVDKRTVIQVDLNHLEKADDKDDPRYPVLDELKKLLPKSDDKSYLSVFVLTHPDQDHCRGFSELLKKVTINELWFTPRVFSEYKKDLSDDAKALQTEAKRRLKVVIKNKGKVNDGDRIRVIGYDDLLKEDDYKDLPKDLLTIPGNTIDVINGSSKASAFSAFIQSPFKDDADGDRNDTSLGMQVVLKSADNKFRVLLLGDLAYPTIRRIFDRSEKENLSWDVFLAPHHCSKKVMYVKDENDEDTLKKDMMDSFESNEQDDAYIIASSQSDFTDEKGDDPPHTKARKQYEKITVSGHFLYTAEYPDKKNPEPIEFKMVDGSFSLSGKKGADENKKSSLAAAVATARGSDAPPHEQVGFGK